MALPKIYVTSSTTNTDYSYVINYQGWNIPDHYIPISKDRLVNEEWDTCPVCHRLPRLWEFNNGNVSGFYCFGLTVSAAILAQFYNCCIF